METQRREDTAGDAVDSSSPAGGEAGQPRGLLSRVKGFPQAARPGGGDGGGAGSTRGRLTGWLNSPRGRLGLNYVGAGLVAIAAMQYLWPAPLGLYIQGVVIGSLTALMAFGITLIYRSNRIVNFAHGDLGAVPAVLAVLLIVGGLPGSDEGISYFAALGVLVIVSLAMGALLEFVIIRRFFTAPRLILTVATIALAPMLAFVSVVLPAFFQITTPPQSFPSPFDFSFEIGGTFFRGNAIIAMVTVVVVIAGLAAFFRFTNIGIAVRASAESANRAFLLGIPVKRVQTYVWAIASLLAAIALFMRAGIVGLPIGEVLGPAMLLNALAAAVIGRMQKLPVVFVAAVGIGIVEQSIIFHTGRALLLAPVLFFVILAALLFQRRGVVARTEEATWQAVKDIRAIPREVANLPEVLWVRRGLTAAGIGALLALPLFLAGSRLLLAAAIAIFAIIGLSLVVLTGWAGQVSLGQMAFVGIGAAVAGSVTTRLEWDLSLSLIIAGLAGAAVAILIGLPALRIRGLFLAVTTLAFSLATVRWLLRDEFFGWWLPSGRIPRTPLFGLIATDTEVRYYYFSLAALALAILAVRSVRNSHVGRTLIATRENERAVASYGVNVTAAKLTAFALSGFLAAFAGGLFIHHQQALDLGSFTPEVSIGAFIMVVVGGLGSIAGAIIGALYFRGGLWFLPGDTSFLVSGLGLLVILMLLPQGLGGLMYQGRDWYLRRVAQRRRILVPSLLADAREADVVFSGPQLGDGTGDPDAPLLLSGDADAVAGTPEAPGNGVAADTGDVGPPVIEVETAGGPPDVNGDTGTGRRRKRRGSGGR